MKYHIFELRSKVWRNDWSSQLYTQLSICQIKAWKSLYLYLLRPERDSKSEESDLLLFEPNLELFSVQILSGNENRRSFLFAHSSIYRSHTLAEFITCSKVPRWDLYNTYDFWRRDWSSQLCTQLEQLWKAWRKHWRLNEIRTHDLCDTDAVLYQLSYQANWEMVTKCEFVIYP